MSDTTHTPEPWRVEKNGACWNLKQVDSAAHFIFLAGMVGNPPEELEANAARIVACVNACEGLNPEAVPDLLAALKDLASIARMYHTGEQEGHEDACESPDCCGHCLAMRKVNAAIAKATGGNN